MLLVTCYLLLGGKVLASGFSVGFIRTISKITQETQTTSTIPIYLQNYDANNAIDLNFQIRPFVPSNKFDGQAEIVPQTTTLNADYQNLLSHIKIIDGDSQISKLTLSPTQRKQITLTIEIPKDFPQGDYYFSFIAKSNPSSLDDTNISSIRRCFKYYSYRRSADPNGKTKWGYSEFFCSIFSAKWACTN